MKKLILVAFFVQLGIIINAYKIGDLISFKRKKGCNCQPITYKHFAVYVGKEPIEGKNSGQDIFHNAGPGKGCIFGKLQDEEGTPIVENYLDEKYSPGDDKAILQRIIEKKQNCGRYNLLKNNCEHLATYVRNNAANSEQRGTTFDSWKILCHYNKGPGTTAEKNIETKYDDQDFESFPCDKTCNSCKLDSRGPG